MKYAAHVFVEGMYLVLCLMRWLFLSSNIGARIHNFLLCNFSRRIAKFTVEEARGYLTIMQAAEHGNTAALAWERRMYCLAPSTRRRMLKNVFGWAGIVGRRRRRKWTKRGFVIPRLVFISPTYRCNLSCPDCYAASPRPGDLPFEVLVKLVGELQELGVFSVLLLGGEPFIRKDLWSLFKKYPQTIFSIYTNATFLGKEEIQRIARLGNIRLLISMEGFRENTDARRGVGVFDIVVRCLELCRQANIIYGASVTVTRKNFQEVTSNEFIEWLVGRGALHVNYIPFMPMGRDEHQLTLTTAQVRELDGFARSVVERYPIFPSVGRSGSDLVTNCDAANRMLHITADGDVEPCMFVPWTAGNIKTQTILEVMQSPFFQTIRGLNQTGETRLNPCKWQNSRFLELALRESGAHPTREKKEVLHGEPLGK